MPELPEVETTVKKVRPLLVGNTVTRFKSFWPKQVLPSMSKVQKGITDQAIIGLRRRAKQIICDLDNDTHLLIHLKMSGRLECLPNTSNEPKHVRALFELSNGNTLFFCDARKFGRIQHVNDLEQAIAQYGPEPLDPSFDAKSLHYILSQRKRQLKPLLLDQSVIAGLGNIYTDEALHRARLHPLRRSDGLDWDETKLLHRSIRQVLREAIKRCGTSFDWAYPGGRMQNHLRVYQRQGKPCSYCHHPIQVIRIGQRSTHFCPECQKE
jgi:formamidopyrimidine-DNA glycosylase